MLRRRPEYRAGGVGLHTAIWAAKGDRQAITMPGNVGPVPGRSDPRSGFVKSAWAGVGVDIFIAPRQGVQPVEDDTKPGIRGTRRITLMAVEQSGVRR